MFWIYDEYSLLDAVKKYDSSSINSMIKAAMLASVKEVIGQYTAQEIIENQSTVSSKVMEAITSKLADRPVTVTSVNISNYNWSAEYDRMINETMQVKQQVKKAEQQLQVAELEAQQRVKQAEASTQAQLVEAEADKKKREIEAEANLIKIQKEAEAALIKAEKEAEARKLQADAEAYYYEQLSKNLEVQELLRRLDIEAERASAWDGREIPNYIPLTAGGAIVSLK